jgi:molybdopterin-containing oxidoreductase family iron-sulfur binding subunit
VACQQACPTNAINFGNANDKTSSIAKQGWKSEQISFYVLEQLRIAQCNLYSERGAEYGGRK